VLVLLRGPDAVPALLDLLGDPDPSVRTASARLLGDVGDRTVVDALALAQLRDPDPGVVRSIEDAHRRVEGRVLADDVADGPGDR
jgi:HEAT repeat protein